MRRLFLILVLALPLRSGAGELLDRVIVSVNGKPLLESDWSGEVRYELFMSGRAISASTVQDRQGALDRIIDQELLRQQGRAADFRAATPEEIDVQMELLRKQSDQEHPGESWDGRLREYGLNEGELRAHVQMELNQLRVVDARLRPSIQVDASEIEAYYRTKVQTEAGNAAIPYAEAVPKIREILVQQKMNQFLESWLESLRAQAKIQHFPVDTSSPVQPQ
jgi:hypothetical protein